MKEFVKERDTFSIQSTMHHSLQRMAEVSQEKGERRTEREKHPRQVVATYSNEDKILIQHKVAHTSTEDALSAPTIVDPN